MSEESKSRKISFWFIASIFLLVGIIIGGVIGYFTAATTIAPVTVVKTEKITLTVTEESSLGTEVQSSSEEEYLNWVKDFSKKCTPIFLAIHIISQKVSNEEILLSEAAVKFSNLRIQLKSRYREASSITPPPKYEECHNHLLRGLDYWVTALEYMAEGCRKYSSTLMNKALHYSDLANDELEKALNCLGVEG